ncbi:hypothetical protein KOI35_32530 [Actinoplanes bogorensis]|uniref:Uncharacterized protein n=1 Tax=Paractinoplanes bogorensis TaxID=1610840 RepID=A0ABS5YXT3_9ACTN|nr:hypothetical protein [Actinoplanes bogorensis]MBU2668249.1 hypothetical protein [Actinoplanes bogorensis]
MGLFDSGPALEDVVGAKLVNTDERSRRELARAQLPILRELRDEELLLVIAVDRDTGVIVVTNERLFTVRRGKLDRRIERNRIREAKLGQLPRGGFVAIIAGPELRVAFATLDEADLFVQTIDLAMVNSRVVRRNIPVLMPDLYEEILRTSGRPVESRLVIAVARAAAEMIAAHARTFFTTIGDQGAADRFGRDFGDRRGVTTADDMIDWLWDWDPRCHQPLRRAVGIMRIRLIDTHH